MLWLVESDELAAFQRSDEITQKMTGKEAMFSFGFRMRKRLALVNTSKD